MCCSTFHMFISSSFQFNLTPSKTENGLDDHCEFSDQGPFNSVDSLQVTRYKSSSKSLHWKSSRAQLLQQCEYKHLHSRFKDIFCPSDMNQFFTGKKETLKTYNKSRMFGIDRLTVPIHFYCICHPTMKVNGDWSCQSITFYLQNKGMSRFRINR